MRYLMLTAILLAAGLSSGAQEKKLYLVPDSAKGIRISQIVESINLIPLQTSKASYFNNMADFLVTHDRLIFKDNDANAILVFDKQGKFLHRFKKKRYTIGALQYDHKKNAIFFKSSNKNFTIGDRKRFEMMQNPGKRDFSKYINLELLHLGPSENYRIEKLPVFPYQLGNIYYMSGRFAKETNRYNPFEKDTVVYHLDIFEAGKKVTSFFPFLNLPKLAMDFDNIDVSIDRTLNDSTFFIHKDYDNNIYKLVNDSLYLAYNFIFPAANTMQGDFYTTRFRNNLDYNEFKTKSAKVVKSFFNIIELKDLLFFGMNDNSWGYKRFVFNKNSSAIYDLSKATSDSVTHYLPSNVFNRISNYDEDYIYTFISPADLIKEKTNILNRYKNSKPSQQLVAILENVTKFSNPVIIQLKLKTNITK